MTDERKLQLVGKIEKILDANREADSPVPREEGADD